MTAPTLPATGSSRGDGGAQLALWVLLAGIGAIVVARRRQAA
ncbi:MAG: LPXTG cell wall anchor domain-containing protein [Actinomycetota bacterium]